MVMRPYLAYALVFHLHLTEIKHYLFAGIRTKIEKLHSLIAEKDAKLFDMESSMASIEAEANYRITKAERDASNQVKATQDELRRVQKEVDTKSLTIAKMKKRKLSTASVASSSAVNSDATRTIAQAQAQAQTASQTPTSVVKSTAAFDNHLNWNSHSIDAPMLTKKASTNNVSPIKHEDATTTPLMKQSPRSTTVTPVQNIADRQHSNKSILSLSKEPASRSNDEIAKHLLLHLNMLSTQLSSSPTDMKQVEQRPNKTDDCNNISIPMEKEFDDSMLDESKIRRLIHLLTIEKTQQQENSQLQTQNSSSKQDYFSSRTSTETVPSISITTLCKELICLIVSRLQLFFKRSKNLKPQSSDINSSTLLSSILVPLSTLNEICFISSQARCCIRKWICDSHRNKTNFQNSFTYETNNHFLPQITSYRTPIRIRGVSLSQRKKLEIASGQIRNIISSTQEEYGSTGNITSWDDTQRTIVCHNFLSFLSNLMIGSSQLDAFTLSALVTELGKRLQIQCMAFLLSLTHDCPREAPNSRIRTPCQRIWSLFFDHLFPIYDETNRNTSDQCLKDFFSAATIGDNNTSINRRNYLIGKGRTASKGKALSKTSDNFQPNIISSDHLSYKVLLFQLLYHIFQSSKDAQRIVFERKMKSCRDGVSMARVFFAVTLDELQINLLPILKQHNAPSTTANVHKKSTISQVTSLVWYMIRLLSLLCETKTGLILIQTQMKTGERGRAESNSDAASGITVLVDALEFSVHALIQDNSPGILKQHLNEITSSCIAFFYYLFSHYHKYLESPTQRRKEKNMFSLMLYDADRLPSFQSCCKLIVSFNSPTTAMDSIVGDVTKKRARIMLYQLLAEGS